MRFYEFKTIISEATKGNQADVPKFDAPGYFSVGDSHSNGVGNYGRGKTWKAMGMDGASAYDPMHMSAIDRIPAGSVVAISLGANDHKGVKTEQELKKMREAIKGKRVFWIDPGKDRKPIAHEAIMKIAGEYGDTVLSRPAGNMSSDGVHPTGKGYKILADQTK